MLKNNASQVSITLSNFPFFFYATKNSFQGSEICKNILRLFTDFWVHMYFHVLTKIIGGLSVMKVLANNNRVIEDLQ